jgi:hypothetical protein
VQSVLISLPWLLTTSRPEVAEWIEESILGAKIHRVHGGNFGSDALSLSFSGNLQRDKHFVPLSQGHCRNQFKPVGPPIARTVMKGKKAGAKHSKSSIARKSVRKQAGSVSHGRGDAILTECHDTNGNATTSLQQRGAWLLTPLFPEG